MNEVGGKIVPGKLGRRFDGKVAVVTWGSKGIGRATALRLAYEWAMIAITESHDKAATEEVIKKIQSLSSQCLALPCDIKNSDDIRKFLKAVIDRYGRIDVLVHCAGISPNIEFDDQTDDDWKEVLDVNIIGSFRFVQQTRALMINLAKARNERREAGSIVLLGSTNGINSNDPISAPYDSSKAWVNLLANTVAKLYQKWRVRINSVAPGWVETSINNTLPKDYRKSEEKLIHLGRFAEPAEIANIIAFLASDEASYINGTTIMVDWGYK